ncbi:MAG: hypothetical protein WCV84_00340 [Patescibacteria group bacterium]
MMHLSFKRIAGALLLSGILMLPAASFAKTIRIVDPPVKKSTTSICHAKGTRYYKQTLKFVSYKTLKECLKSGGRLPKK